MILQIFDISFLSNWCLIFVNFIKNMDSLLSFLNKHKFNLMLSFVICWGAILRFYKIDLIPITLDEFSAYFRLKFDSFDELINKGIKVDGHPAGVQSFLFYWKKLVGSSTWIMKFPFIICGVFATYYIYKLSANWFSSTSALWITTFYTSIQYTVFYSQVFRPYAPGMFFTLFTTYYWSKLLFNKTYKANVKDYIFFILGSILASYNHHFSLFFIFTLVLLGVFYVKQNNFKYYFLSILLIAICYLPHLTIFFYQLKVGGLIASLPKPTIDFFYEYLDYIFQYSGYTKWIALLLFILSIYGFFKEKITTKYIIISAVLFLTPLLVGYFYSIFRSPVLQYSVLIFSFPFFLFLLFGGVPKLSSITTFIGILIILVLNTLGLYFERKHYTLFYKSNYEEAILLGSKYTSSKVYKLIEANDIHRKATFYYMYKHKIKKNWNFISPMVDFIQFNNQIKRISSQFDTLFFACDFSSYPSYIPIIQSYFPKIEKKWNYLNGTSYLFTKSSSNQELITNMDFTHPKLGWTSIENITGVDQLGICNVDSLTEYVISYDAKLWDIIKTPNDFIDISLRVCLSNTKSKAMITSSLDNDSGNIDWRSTTLSSFQENTKLNQHWITVYHSIKFSDINVRDKDIRLKIGIWNIEKENFKLDDIQIIRREGNPYLYGVTEKYFTDPLDL